MAVLAHEVAHGRNGDLRRGGYQAGGASLDDAQTANAAERLAAMMLAAVRILLATVSGPLADQRRADLLDT